MEQRKTSLIRSIPRIMDVLALVAILLFALPFITDAPIHVDDSFDGSRAFIEIDHSVLVWPVRSCITVAYAFEQVNAVYLNERGTVGMGEAQFCDYPQATTFRIITQNGTEQIYELAYDVVPPVRQIGLVLLAIFALAFRWLQRLNRQRVFVLTCVLFFTLAMAERTLIAFSTDSALNWDETYYASIASTAAHGIGLYPYVQGYAEVPYMGGVGLTANLYTLAYQVLGAHVWGLRFVSLLVGMLGLMGAFVLADKWYGRSAAWVTLALVPYLTLFQFTNSIRMDTITFAYGAWALVMFALAQDRKDRIGWQVATGFVFALGLQAHLHTFAVAFACGFVYLLDAIADAYKTRDVKRLFNAAMLGYVAGYLIGFLAFVAINVMPDPEAFLRTAGLARLRASGLAEDTALDGGRLLQSFAAPQVIFNREWTRYSSLIRDLPVVEVALWAVALVALFFTRRHPQDARLRTLFLGGVIGAALILNAAAYGYLSHALPVLLVPLAPLITQGLFSKGDDVAHGLSVRSWVVLLIVGSALLNPPAYAERVNDLLWQGTRISTPSDLVQRVKVLAATDCHIAGDATDYIAHFMEYPRFTSTRQTEVQLGSDFYGLPYDEYWREKQPDVIFGALNFGLDRLVGQMQYVEVSPAIWVKPDDLRSGCRIATL